GPGRSNTFRQRNRRGPLTDKQCLNRSTAEPTACRKNYSPLSGCLVGLPLVGQVWRGPKSTTRAAVIGLSEEDGNFSFSLYPPGSRLLAGARRGSAHTSR